MRSAASLMLPHSALSRVLSKTSLAAEIVSRKPLLRPRHRYFCNKNFVLIVCGGQVNKETVDGCDVSNAIPLPQMTGIRGGRERLCVRRAWNGEFGSALEKLLLRRSGWKRRPSEWSTITFLRLLVHGRRFPDRRTFKGRQRFGTKQGYLKRNAKEKEACRGLLRFRRESSNERRAAS